MEEAVGIVGASRVKGCARVDGETLFGSASTIDMQPVGVKRLQ
jgi:hypothetical protein